MGAVGRYTTSIEPALRPLLADGERVIVASPLVSDPGTTKDVSVADELTSLLDPTLLLGMSHPGNLIQRVAFGRAVVGPEGSIARRLYDSIEAAGYDLVLTDSRLLIVKTDIVTGAKEGNIFQRWFGPTDMHARLVHELPRDWILGAVAAPKGFLRRGRFFAAFVDGSGAAVVCVHPRAARETVAALGPPQLESRATGEEHA